MRILARYIIKRILGAIITVLFTLTIIFSFFAFIGEIEDVGTGRYDLFSAAYVVVLEVPKLIVDLMPFATLIGAIVALGSLAELNEIVAVQAAGGSKTNFLVVAIQSAAVLVLFTVSIGEFIVPFSEAKADRIKLVFKKDADFTLTEEGFWARDENTFINMKVVLTGHVFKDVAIYEFNDNNQLVKISIASTAKHDEGDWYLEGVRETVFTGKAILAQTRESALWESNLDPKAVEMVALKPSTHTVLSLYRYWKFSNANGQRSDHLERALWMKLASPLTIFAMIIVSLSIATGSQRSVSLSRRALLGSSMGLGYHVICELLEQSSAVYGLSPSASVLLPPLLLLGLVVVWQNRLI